MLFCACAGKCVHTYTLCRLGYVWGFSDEASSKTSLPTSNIADCRDISCYQLTQTNQQCLRATSKLILSTRATYLYN